MSNSVENEPPINYCSEVIYQIMTDRFYSPKWKLNQPEDKNLKDYCGGNWLGICEKIQDGYLIELGVTALLISPHFENVTDVYDDHFSSFHGYWTKDFKRVNEKFGTLDDFKKLIAVAHEHNLKIIIDFVPHHTSPVKEDNPSFCQDGALFNDGKFVASYHNDPDNVFMHNGTTDFRDLEDANYKNLCALASLNLLNKNVDKYLKESIKLWLDHGIDGIRIDAGKHMPFAWQKSLADYVYSYKPVIIFGEWFDGSELDEGYKIYAKKSGLNMLDFVFLDTMHKVLRNDDSSFFELEKLIVTTTEIYDNQSNLLAFIDNHDVDRFFKEGEFPRKLDMAMVLLMTLRGIPIIYYGTEQYLTGNADPENRRLMPGFNRLSLAYKTIRKLADLIKTNMSLVYGSTDIKYITDDVVFYERKFNENMVLVAINKSYKDVFIVDIETSLPANKDYIDHLSETIPIVVDATGKVKQFNLSAITAYVWTSSGPIDTSPLIGFVGPQMRLKGEQVYIDGSGFGYETKGRIFFDDHQVGDEDVLQWTGQHIQLRVPAFIKPGAYGVKLENAANLKMSNVYRSLHVMTARQICIRFVLQNAKTIPEEQVYVMGNVYELGEFDADKASGPMYNKIVYLYPDWYYDISVPIGEHIEFKFFIRNKTSDQIQLEAGPNHSYVVPDHCDTVIVKWQD